jgi:hypothetical protein
MRRQSAVRAGVVHRYVVAVVLLLLLGAAAGCGSSSGAEVVGSSAVTTKAFDLSGFTALRVDNDFSATVSRGDAFKVSVTVNENLVQYLQVEVKGDTLHIGLDPSVDYRLTNLRADITLPRISGAEASGASDVYLADFSSTDALSLKVSGASQLSLEAVKAGAVTFDGSGGSRIEGTLACDDLSGAVSGASTATMIGSASTAKLGASGAGKLLMNNFAIKDATVNLSGASEAAIRATGTLNVDLSGGSRLDYYGSARLGETSVTGASQITHVQD